MWMSTSDAVLPAKPSVYRSIEGLIQHFEVLMPNRGFDVPTRRAVRGDGIAERGAWVLYRGRWDDSRAYRARTRPPSYIHFALLPHMTRATS